MEHFAFALVRNYWKEELNAKYLTRQNAKEIREEYRQEDLDFKQW